MLGKAVISRESEIKIEMRKASFGGDRSEAGRYAANIRWQNREGEQLKESGENTTTANLTDDERSLLQNYSDYRHESINFYLRTPNKWNATMPFKPRVAEEVETLKKIFKKLAVPTQKDSVLYRGVGVSKNKNFKVGDVFRDKGFASTSKNKNQALVFANDPNLRGESVLLEIRVPKGHKVLPMTESLTFHPDENEVLLKNGTKFKVVEIKKNAEPRKYGSKGIDRVIVEIVGESQ